MEEPGLFFRAYRQFSDRYTNTFLKFFGWQSMVVLKEADSFLRKGSWEAVERVEHSQAIQALKRSSILLANLSNENLNHCIPAKLYEYIAARRPILLIGPETGEAANIIHQTKTGRVVGFDSQEIYKVLEEYYYLWRHGFKRWNPDDDEISKFDGREQARQLAQVLKYK